MKKSLLFIITPAILIAVIAGILLLGKTPATNNGSTPKEITPKQPDEIVEIKDINLKEKIKDQQNIETEEITGKDIDEIYGLTIHCEDGEVTSLEGLQYALNLESISIKDCENIESLYPISNLPNLSYFNFSYSNTSEVGGDFNTPLLARVSFIDTNIDDFEFLKGCSNVVDLYISDSGVTNIDFVKDMNDLEEISVRYSSLSDISGIANKEKLTIFDIHKSNVSDISALQSCSSLEQVNISYNDVVSLEPLYNLSNLYELTAYEEPMTEDMLIHGDHLSYLSNKGVIVNTHRVID